MEEQQENQQHPPQMVRMASIMPNELSINTNIHKRNYDTYRYNIVDTASGNKKTKK